MQKKILVLVSNPEETIPLNLPRELRIITALKDENRYVRGKVAWALGKIGNPVCLEKLLQLGDRNLIERKDVFPLARSWAVRFSQKGLPFIPVYPEVIAAMSTINRAEELEW